MPSIATRDLLSEGVQARLAHLRQLPAGWDGTGTAAPRADALTQIESVLRELGSQFVAFEEPAIIPKFDGTLQLEWHSPRRSLEFDFAEAGWEILGEDRTEGAPVYFSADVGLLASKELHAFYEWWAGERSAWPM